MPARANPILLYDGVCGLCNRLVQFVIRRDPNARFRFAALQSSYASRILQRHHLDPDDLETLYIVDDPGNFLAARSDAVISLLRQLGGPWRAAAAALSIVPKPLRDWGYAVLARQRYRVFGKFETCVLPEMQYQDRFLDT
jgi:predicted DCC family thiol-disulfide oxidoreductase YuxK